MGSIAVEEKNCNEAAKLWKESSELGNAKAKFNLALCYEHGKGVEQDKKEVWVLHGNYFNTNFRMKLYMK